MAENKRLANNDHQQAEDQEGRQNSRVQTPTSEPRLRKSLQRAKIRGLVAPEVKEGPRSTTAKLRPAGDILNRIRWDPVYHTSDFIIGYLDRFDGVAEIQLDLWIDEVTGEDFIPQHRIRYFKHKDLDKIIWHREDRTDLLFDSGLPVEERVEFEM